MKSIIRIYLAVGSKPCKRTWNGGNMRLARKDERGGDDKFAVLNYLGCFMFSVRIDSVVKVILLCRVAPKSKS